MFAKVGDMASPERPLGVASCRHTPSLRGGHLCSFYNRVPVQPPREELLGLSDRSFLSLYRLLRAETDYTAVLQPLPTLGPVSFVV